MEKSIPVFYEVLLRANKRGISLPILSCCTNLCFIYNRTLKDSVFREIYFFLNSWFPWCLDACSFMAKIITGQFPTIQLLLIATTKCCVSPIKYWLGDDLEQRLFTKVWRGEKGKIMASEGFTQIGHVNTSLAPCRYLNTPASGYGL